MGSACSSPSQPNNFDEKAAIKNSFNNIAGKSPTLNDAQSRKRINNNLNNNNKPFTMNDLLITLQEQAKNGETLEPVGKCTRKKKGSASEGDGKQQTDF